MQNIRCRPSEPRHPSAKYNRKFSSNFWRILSEKRIFSVQKSRSWGKISKIATIRLFNTVRSIGSPIFMSFRQRNRCDHYWRLFLAKKSQNFLNFSPESVTNHWFPIVSGHLKSGLGGFGFFRNEKMSPDLITSIPLVECHKNWWSYSHKGIVQ